MCLCARDIDLYTYIREVGGSVGGGGMAANRPQSPTLARIGVRARKSMRADAHTDVAIALSAGGAGEGCGDGAAPGPGRARVVLATVASSRAGPYARDVAADVPESPT